MLADGVSCGRHRIERLMRQQGLARPRCRRLPVDTGERSLLAVSPNVLDRQFAASAPNRKWVADFTYIWTDNRGLALCGSGARSHVPTLRRDLVCFDNLHERPRIEHERKMRTNLIRAFIIGASQSAPLQ
jgi:transposase InsO family protein